LQNTSVWKISSNECTATFHVSSHSIDTQDGFYILKYTNGRTNLNETHLQCIECTQAWLQKDPLISVDSLHAHTKMFSILYVKSHFLIEIDVKLDPSFLRLRLEPVFSIGLWVIGYYLIV
jgi:hypothetical protein